MTLQNATSDFLLHCRIEKNLSTKTLKAYETDLTQLNTFFLTIPTIDAITRQDLREYLASMGTLKSKSIKRKIAVVKALFNFLEFEDKISINPFRKMRIQLREEKKLPSVMNMKEISKILTKAYASQVRKDSSVYAHFEALRDTLVIELLFSTGARVSEIANLRIEHINIESGSILIKGKGNKERIVFICNQEPIMLLKKYNTLYRQKIKDAGGFFLINRFNKSLSDQSIRSIVKKFTRQAGITRHITPHVFRHSFATLLLEKDVDIRYIQHLLGHSSIATTQIYTHVNRAKQRQILRTKHPRRDISMILEQIE